MPKQITINVYEFNELSPVAKKVAINNRRRIEEEGFWDWQGDLDKNEYSLVLAWLGMANEIDGNSPTGRTSDATIRLDNYYGNGHVFVSFDVCYLLMMNVAEAEKKIKEHFGGQDGEYLLSMQSRLHALVSDWYRICGDIETPVIAVVPNGDYDSAVVPYYYDHVQDDNLNDKIKKATEHLANEVKANMDGFGRYIYNRIQESYDIVTGDESIAEYLSEGDDEFLPDGETYRKGMFGFDA